MTKSLASAARAAAEPGAVEVAPTAAPDQPAIIKALESPRQLEELAKALPPGLNPQRFARMALTLIKSDPKMLELGSTPEGTKSLITALHRCAQLGLEVGADLGQAHLLPFRIDDKLTLQFILGYKGILTLARRSGSLRRLDVHEVYENDEFEFSYGIGGTIHHKPTMGKRGEIVCYYGYAEFMDGGYYYTVLTPQDVADRKARSASVKSGRRSPWDTDPIPMAKKSVIRAMAPYLPLSGEAQDAIADDEKMVVGDEMTYIDVDSASSTPVNADVIDVEEA